MAWLYRKCARHKIIKGRYIAAVVLAMAKIACGEIGIVRDISPLARGYDASEEEISSAESAIKDVITIERTPKALIDLVAGALHGLGADEKATAHASKLLQRFLVNLKKSPRIINKEIVAGTIVYKAMRKAEKKAGQKEIAKLFGISERSIRRFKN